MTKSALVSTQWLQAQLGKVKILDASYGLPWEEDAPRIADAQFFDIDKVADPRSDMAHMLPSAEMFEKKAGALGVTEQDTVVVYDRAGIAMAASRAWWMFRIFGHKNVFVLDGGLPKWLDEKRPTETITRKPVPAIYHADFRPELVRNLDQMRKNLQTKEELVLDARAEERFNTLQGHIPGSLNTPYQSLINPDGTLCDKDDLKKILSLNGADLGKPMATTCGSGVTACVLALALYELGRDDVPVYDGSWTEWGSHPQTPKEIGACQARKEN